MIENTNGTHREMTQEEMKEALEHDQAIKAAKPADPQVEPSPQVRQQAVPLQIILDEIEKKQTLLAKTVAMGLVDLARQFTEAAANTDRRKVVVDKKTGEQRIESEGSRPGAAEACLEIVQVALDLARKADALGDRPLARSPLATPETTKAS